MKVCFAVTEARPDAAAGDAFTALELGEALAARFGWEVEYRPKDGWYDLGGVDLLIAMVDDYELPAIRHAAPTLRTIAWARNWFERWAAHPWVAEYDLLLASSTRAVHYLSENTGKLARLLRIATNPVRFSPQGRPERSALEYVFTGHYWQATRDVVDALSALPARYRGAVYGRNWEQVPALAPLHRGVVPYGHIHAVYHQAPIVIDDANHVTKDWGAANSRVFDALAAGCLVITNSASVSDEVFNRLLPVYQNPAHLEQLLAHYLADAPARTELTTALRKQVLRHHCYAHRAFELGLYLRGTGAQAGEPARIGTS